MGKASRAKRDQRTNQTCSAGAAAQPFTNAALAHVSASSNGLSFKLSFNGVLMSGHELVIRCLDEDNFVLLHYLEKDVGVLGWTCFDLLFSHDSVGAKIDIFTLAVACEAKRCIEILTVMAGEQGRADMLTGHLNHLLACVGANADGKPLAFARAHLKEHFARSRNRGAQNVAALVQHAQAAGCGSAAAILIGEIEAEELADFERRELEVLLAPRANTRSAAKAL